MELPQVTVALGADGLEPLLAAIGQLSGFPAPIWETAGYRVGRHRCAHCATG